jgi:hypothetical protein
MQHVLWYTTVVGRGPNSETLRSPAVRIIADTNLGPSPQLAWPSSFSGKLINVPIQKIREIRSDENLEVGFEGKRYRFSRLDDDGGFELSLITR